MVIVQVMLKPAVAAGCVEDSTATAAATTFESAGCPAF